LLKSQLLEPAERERSWFNAFDPSASSSTILSPEDGR
jgi:hypothetical protein